MAIASGVQQPRRLSSGGGERPRLERRESENRAPERRESKGKGKSREVVMEIDSDSPDVGAGKKRSRIIQSDEEEGDEEDQAPRKVSPSVGRKERVPVRQVEMMELVDDEDEEEDEVQVMGPPKAAGKAVGSKFKGLALSLKGRVKAEEVEEMHCYLVSRRLPSAPSAKELKLTPFVCLS